MTRLLMASLALMVGGVSACSSLLTIDCTDVAVDDPYVAFTNAVTAVEPLIDPNLDAIADPQAARIGTATQSAQIIRLPSVAPLEVAEDITVSTSPELLSLNETLYQRFVQAGYSGVKDLNTMAASTAIQRFCEQPEVNLLTISRQMTPAEVSRCRANGRQPVEFPIGRDALLIIVNGQDRFVRGVTLDKLGAMLTRNRWSDLDAAWPSETITRGLIGPDSTAVTMLTQTLFDTNSAPLLNAPNTTFYDYPEPMIQALNITPYSLGVINYSTYQRLSQNVRVVPINGISASLETVESGAYPLGQTVYLYADRQQLAGRSPTSTVVNFYLTYMNDAIPEVALMPLTPTQLNAAKTTWLEVMELDQSLLSLENLTSEPKAE